MRALALSLVCITLLCRTSDAVASELRVEPIVTGGVGTTFLATVTLYNASQQISVLGFDFNYDPAVLRYDGMIRGPIGEACTSFTVEHGTPGRLQAGGFKFIPFPVGTTGVVVQFRFTVLAWVSTPTAMTIDGLDNDLEGTPVTDAYYRSNTKPVAQDLGLSTNEDTAAAVTLVASDADGDPVTYPIVAGPSHGSLSGTAPNLTYTPVANYNGPDSFTFKANDGAEDGNIATVSLTVTAVNDAPVAQTQSVTTNEDTAKAITLAATDVEGSSLTYSVVTGPSHGALSGTVPNLTYTPAANYHGPDSFTFKANDGTVDGNTATVSLTVTAVNDAPVAQAQSVTTDEDTAKAVTLAAADADGDSLTYTTVVGPSHGALSGTAPNLTYTPEANYNGPDSFTFKANDGTVDSNVATVSLTVTAVNDAPVAQAQSLTTDEDTAKAVTLAATDVEGSSLTYSVVTGPTHGALSGTAPNLTYTPEANHHGTDSFTFKANDGTVDSNVAMVNITVTAVNDAPVAQDQSATTAEDTSKAITLIATDVDGDTLTYAIAIGPAHGSLSGTPPNLTYTPAPDYTGADSFTFKADDGTIDSNIATVSLTVTAVNDAPVAQAQSLTTDEDTAKAVTLAATDADGGSLTYETVVGPSHGALSGTAPNLTYTPEANYHGPDSFTFSANDGTADSNIATVSLTVTAVNDAPVAQAQSLTTDEDTAKAVTLAATDVDGDSLTYTVVTGPTHGALSGAVPNLTYTPTANYHGPDSFTFKVNDGTVDSNIATVNLTVTSLNDVPVAQAQSLTTNEDTAKTITLAATDSDGDSLSYTVAAGPSHGALSGTAPNLTYTPAANYGGPDSFTFKVNDGTADSNIATVSLTVTAVNDTPVAQDQSLTTDEDTAKAVTLAATDPDGDSLTCTVVTGPTHGTLSGTVPNLTYTPAANYHGPDSFTFKANDGTVDGNTATVSLTVTAVNDAPVAQAQSVTTDEDTAIALTLLAADPDGDALTYSVVVDPAHGTLSGTAPNLTYTPAADYSGPDSFTFSANDGTGDSNIATVSLTVTAVNDTPVAQDQSVTTDEDTATSVTLAATDADGDALTYTVVEGPSHGALNGTLPNLTYTPTADYNGPDSFTFKANDGTVDGNVATVNLTITPVDDLPIAQDQSQMLLKNEAGLVVLGADDVDGDHLTYSVVSGPNHGTLSGTPPNLTYTPVTNYYGEDSFTFQANDGKTDSNVATVSLTIKQTNDAPVAQGQSVTTGEDTASAITLTATDVDDDPLTYSVVDGPAHGTLSGTPPNLTYTPEADYYGPDSFTFKTNDTIVDSNTATVSLTISSINDAPVAQDANITTPEDTSQFIVLGANDAEGDPLGYTVVTGPAHGSLSGTTPNLTYTPAADYHGPDSFTFTASDGDGNGNTATVSLTVTPVNDAPVAQDSSAATDEDTAQTVTLAATDVDGDPLTYTVLGAPSHGTLSGTAPNLTYTPADGYHGSDSFTFKASDGATDSNIATVSISVTSVNDIPVTQDQSLVTDEDTAAAVTLTATDADGGSLTYEIVVEPGHGALSGTAPNFTYTPTPGYHGADSFTFKASDGTADSNVATVSITVTAVNDIPVAQDQSLATDEDTAKAVTLAATDADGDSLTYEIVVEPGHGALSGTAPNLTYTPEANYHGPDSFTFKANDGTADSNVATVSLTVTAMNDAPVAQDQSLATDEDTAKAVTLAATDADADSLSYTVASGPTHGTLSGTAPNLTYTPTANYNGPDSFTFRANDGTVDGNVATVSLTVTAVNDAPVAQAQSLTTDEDTAKAVTLAADDADGDSLTYETVVGPSHGTLSGTLPNLTYTPAAEYYGPDSFTFKANDGTADSNVATVSLTVTAVNDAPVAQDQNVTTDEDTAIALTLPATDADDDALTYSVVVDPTHGTLSGTAPNLTYTPATDYSGPDSFTFKANDGTVDSNVASIDLTITTLNDAPIAQEQSTSTLEDTAKAITLAATDSDGDSLSYTVAAGPSHGALSGTAPNLTYTPAANYGGPDSFTFKVNDGTADSNIATVSLTVTAVNDTPVAQDQSVTMDEDTAKAVTLAATDPDGDPLTYTVASGPTHGTLSGTVPNLTYTPAANYNGPDHFTFKAGDGTVDSPEATVSLTVTPVNDIPVAQEQSLTTDEDTAIALTLLAADPDGDALTYSVVVDPTHGTLSGTAPNLTYTPAADYSGPDNFTFSANDGTGDSNVATVSLTVTSANDAPVAHAQTIAMDEDGTRIITLAATDADGDALSYSVVSAPAHGILSGAAPGLTYTSEAGYHGPDRFTFTASDGTSESNEATVEITVEPSDDAPVADAGTDQNVQAGALATLDAGASYDPDGDLLGYLWRFDTVPAGSGLTDADIADADTARPSFTPDLSGEYVLTLTVLAGALSAMDTVTLTAYSVNTPPNANAGPDLDGVVGILVLLDATGGNDPDAGPLSPTYRWRFTFTPPESALTGEDLSEPDGAIASFVPDVPGVFELEVEMSDGEASDIDAVQVAVVAQNAPPNADAGPAQHVELAQTVTLDGSGSTDPDNSPAPLTFAWSFVSLPASSSLSDADLVDAGTAAPRFLPDVSGTYVVRLTVSDGLCGDEANVSIMVYPPLPDGDTPPVTFSITNEWLSMAWSARTVTRCADIVIRNNMETPLPLPLRIALEFSDPQVTVSAPHLVGPGDPCIFSVCGPLGLTQLPPGDTVILQTETVVPAIEPYTYSVSLLIGEPGVNAATTRFESTLFGDVNLDHLVNSRDIQAIINAALGVESPDTALETDLNNDGKVNAPDVQMIINLVTEGQSSS